MGNSFPFASLHVAPASCPRARHSLLVQEVAFPRNADIGSIELNSLSLKTKGVELTSQDHCAIFMAFSSRDHAMRLVIKTDSIMSCSESSP